LPCSFQKESYLKDETLVWFAACSTLCRICHDCEDFQSNYVCRFGIGDANAIPVLIASGNDHAANLQFSSMYFFYTRSILGKKVYLKLDEALVKKVILVLLFLSGDVGFF
jgi:hypothetical protein